MRDGSMNRDSCQITKLLLSFLHGAGPAVGRLPITHVSVFVLLHSFACDFLSVEVTPALFGLSTISVAASIKCPAAACHRLRCCSCKAI